MNVDDTQKQQIRGWIEKGLTLAQIQKEMEAKLGLTMTYMELRFLVDDLKVMPKDPEPPKEPEPKKPAVAQPEAEEEDLDQVPAPPAQLGSTKVALTVDTLARPGALVSGKVTFTDGAKADWYLDQDGRLGLVAEKQGYRPSDSDLRAFQKQLQVKLQQMGM